MVEIKGIAINDTISALRMVNGDQAYNTIISQLDGQIKQLFENPISNTGWYPLDFFMKFVELSIKLNENGNEDVLVDRSGIVFEKHLKGIYRFLIKFGSPETIINRVSTVNIAYFRGVSVKAKFDGSNRTVITYTGFEKQHRLVQPTILGFYRKALEMSGAKDIHAKFLTSIEEGKGYCELELTWKKK